MTLWPAPRALPRHVVAAHSASSGLPLGLPPCECLLAPSLRRHVQLIDGGIELGGMHRLRRGHVRRSSWRLGVRRLRRRQVSVSFQLGGGV
jgi:hypothetical protein